MIEILSFVQTPLLCGCVAGRLSLNDVATLLEAKADVNFADLSGVTPIMVCARRHDLAKSEALLKANANPNLQNRWGHTALHTACEADDLDLVELLLKA